MQPGGGREALYEAINNSMAEITTDNSPSRSLVTAAADALPAMLGPELEEAAGYARAEKAEATRRAYRSDFEIFRSWCEARRVLALPASPKAVAAFLAAEAQRGTKPSTISRRLAAIRYAHKLAGHEPPTNAEVCQSYPPRYSAERKERRYPQDASDGRQGPCDGG